MQTYCAALVFCPTESELKRLFWGEQQLPCIKSVSDIERGWDLHRQALTGHDDRVKTIAFSPNGNVLASASKDGTIQFWAIGPIAARGTKQKLIGHYRGIYAIAFSPLDGNILASASTDNIVRLWTIDPIAATWVLKYRSHRLLAQRKDTCIGWASISTALGHRSCDCFYHV